VSSSSKVNRHLLYRTFSSTSLFLGKKTPRVESPVFRISGPLTFRQFYDNQGGGGRDGWGQEAASSVWRSLDVGDVFGNLKRLFQNPCGGGRWERARESESTGGWLKSVALYPRRLELVLPSTDVRCSLGIYRYR